MAEEAGAEVVAIDFSHIKTRYISDSNSAVHQIKSGKNGNLLFLFSHFSCEFVVFCIIGIKRLKQAFVVLPKGNKELFEPVSLRKSLPAKNGHDIKQCGRILKSRANVQKRVNARKQFLFCV